MAATLAGCATLGATTQASGARRFDSGPCAPTAERTPRDPAGRGPLRLADSLAVACVLGAQLRAEARDTLRIYYKARPNPVPFTTVAASAPLAGTGPVAAQQRAARRALAAAVAAAARGLLVGPPDSLEPPPADSAQRRLRDSAWRDARANGYDSLDELFFPTRDSAVAQVSAGNAIDGASHAYSNTWLHYHFARVRGRWVWVHTDRLASS